MKAGTYQNYKKLSPSLIGERRDMTYEKKTKIRRVITRLIEPEIDSRLQGHQVSMTKLVHKGRRGHRHQMMWTRRIVTTTQKTPPPSSCLALSLRYKTMNNINSNV